MRLSARKVRKLRALIEKHRCPVRPGILHDWRLEYYNDWSSWGSVEMYECQKCGELDRT